MFPEPVQVYTVSMQMLEAWFRRGMVSDLKPWLLCFWPPLEVVFGMLARRQSSLT